MLRFRKHQYKKLPITSETEQLVEQHQSNIIEKQWEPFKKALLYAQLIFLPEPDPGYMPYKKEIWPDNVHIFAKITDGYIVGVRICFERMEEFNYWKTWRKESDSFIDKCFELAHSKWLPF